jgi:regulator of sirC expression with transglutaminase-like and TPR domain
MNIKLTRRLLIFNAVVAPIGLSIPSFAAQVVTRNFADKVSAILAASARLTYLQAKIALDSLMGGPLASPNPVIEKLVQSIWQIAGPNPDDKHKLGAIRTVIYDAGPWNDNRPFSYDLRDPTGQKTGSQLLTTYLRTRRGNCVSMPLLYLILAERVGVNASLSTAPLHVFVRYTDSKGRTFNIECTDGAHVMRDDWYRQKLPISDRAMETGLYMRTLTRPEAMAVMASTVVEFLIDNGRYQDAMNVADVVLKYNRRDALTMVHKGSAAAHLIRTGYEEKYPKENNIPIPARARYYELVETNKKMFAAAEALGWTPVQ